MSSVERSKLRTWFNRATFGLLVVLGVGLYLWLLANLSPMLLERDREGSVWYLHHLANQKIEESHELKWTGTAEDRKKLLVEAAELLDRVRELRPDSDYYEYLWAVTDYQAKTFEREEEPEALGEAVSRLETMWEEGDEESRQLANLLSYHYLYIQPDAEKARMFLTRLIDMKPENGLAYERLVDLELAEGNRGKALELLEEMLNRDLISSSYREKLARLYFEQDRWTEAESELSANLAGGAMTSETWLLYGLIKAIEGENRASLEALRSYLGGADANHPFPTRPTEDRLGYPSRTLPPFPYLALEASISEAPEGPK